jgi:hypothetical protein
MRSLPFPALNHEAIYRACAGQTSSAADRAILLGMADRVVAAGAAYNAAAQAEALHDVRTMQMSDRERTLISPLYDRRLVQTKGAGRAAYDEIHSSADYCPYCGFGEIYEIDHFLPKQLFSDLNVLPTNLVPICHPCNHLKRQKTPVNPRDHFIHPYFDELPIDVRWLQAELMVQQGGPVLTFRVELNENVHGIVADRLRYHFRELRLEQRFRRQAASILNEIEAEVTQRAHSLDARQLAAHLKDRADQLASRWLNALDTAAYYAAAASPAYCGGSFRN